MKFTNILCFILAVLLIFNVCRISSSGVYVPASYEEQYFPALDKTLTVYVPPHYEYDYLSFENVLSKLSAIDFDIADEVKVFEKNLELSWRYIGYCLTKIEHNFTDLYSIQKVDWMNPNPITIIVSAVKTLLEFGDRMLNTIYQVLMTGTYLVVAVFFVCVLLIDFLFMLISAMFVFVDVLFYFIGFNLNLSGLLNSLNAISGNIIVALRNLISVLANWNISAY